MRYFFTSSVLPATNHDPVAIFPNSLILSQMAERVGFEPTVPCGTPHFECGTFDRTLPPLRKQFGTNYKRLNLRTILKKGIHDFGSLTLIMM